MIKFVTNDTHISYTTSSDFPGVVLRVSSADMRVPLPGDTSIFPDIDSARAFCLKFGYLKPFEMSLE